MNKKIKCVLAECGIGIENSGQIKLCNASTNILQDKNGYRYRLDQHNLQDVWNNNVTRKEINDALNAGIRHDNCRLCWDAEDSGVQSIRQVVNKTFPNLKPLDNQPRIAILKPGNLCNFGCRTCNAEVSNQLYDIDYKLRGKPSNQQHYKINLSYPEYLKRFESQRKSFHKDNNFWKVMDNWSQGIVHYALFGGEPFVMKPLFDMLNNSYESKYSSKQDLYISTNASIWSEKYIEIIKSFGSVLIGLSVDAIGNQFEYIRHPGKWGQIKTNILKFVELRKDFSHIKLKVSATCNPFNIYYLDELYDFFKELDIIVDVHLIQIPECYDIRIFPQKVKDEIIKKHKDRKDLGHVLSFLNCKMQNSSLHLNDFIYLTRGTDRLRGQKFSSVFPEFNKILLDNSIII